MLQLHLAMYTWDIRRVVVAMEGGGYDWKHIQKPQALEIEHH
jgi:hypothetical protein